LTTNPITTIRQEIIDYVNTNYLGIKLEEDEAIELTDEVIEILVDKIDSKIKYCDQCMKEPTALMEECSYDCLESKKKAFQEIKAMLVKK